MGCIGALKFAGSLLGAKSSHSDHLARNVPADAKRFIFADKLPLYQTTNLVLCPH